MAVAIKEEKRKKKGKKREWECVEVRHHEDVGKTIEEWEKNGWCLHAYQAAGTGAGPMSYTVNHYLLFVREA